MAKTPIYQYPFDQQLKQALQNRNDSSQIPQQQSLNSHPQQQALNSHPQQQGIYSNSQQQGIYSNSQQHHQPQANLNLPQQHPQQQQHQFRDNSPRRPQQFMQNLPPQSSLYQQQQQPTQLSPQSPQQYYNSAQINLPHQQQQQLQQQQQQQQQRQLSPNIAKAYEPTGSPSQPVYGFAPTTPPNLSNVFTCDHLATFTLPTDARIEARDGLDRLKAMEQSTGIWKMRVRLTVKASMLRVSDINSDTLIEEFPLEVVKDLKCMNQSTSSYKNLVMFTIFDGSINELHMFQCLGNQSGTDFVNEVNSATKLSTLKRNPVSKTPRGNEVLPIFPAALIDPSSKKSMKNKFQTVRGNIPRETSNPVESMDRQVKILDLLFSDIEGFITQLHEVAYAYQAKAKRMTVRTSGFGDGLQNMRCKQLQAKEFVDILKEFKLSFILIAKLKKIICNPNAPELIHFLFKPLSLVVNTSTDSNQCSGMDLARSVVSPLITPEVINLFENCLDTTETNLWNELGPAWKKTSNEWHEELPIYVPVFKNGWSPPVEWMKEMFSQSGSPVPRNKMKPVHKTSSNSSTSSSSSSSGNVSSNDAFRMKLLKANRKVYQCCKSYISKNDKELTINTGDIIEVLKDTKNWWKLRNAKGQTGFAPKNFVEPY